MSDAQPVLIPGDTCWRIEPAQRMAVIIDAADYFAHAKAALQLARRRVILIGWDFDKRIRLDPARPDDDSVPDQLGAFLSWLRRERPDLDIYLLKWSFEALAGITRGSLPYFVQDWLGGNRIHLRADAAHPVGSSHHQKIVVIDDDVAFCGGIDMTLNRWDTSDHLPDNDFRTGPDGKQHGPWHDVAVALDGAAARVIADVAYDRWESATGERLEPLPRTDSSVWPADLVPTFTRPEVAVARTIPQYGAHDEVDEIRRLYLAAIAAARRILYIESQYLAARAIVDALAARLAESDGPEIVMILPRHAEGDLERKVMDGARRSALAQLWDADAHNRFRAYYPVTSAGTPIYVHAKVLVVDDVLLRVGSSNLNNRSMGFDSECDVAVQADPHSAADRELRRGIAGVRTRLLAEHLDVSESALTAAMAESSMIDAIDALRDPGRTLHQFDAETIVGEDSILAGSDIFDPEKVGALTMDRIVQTILRMR